MMDEFNDLALLRFKCNDITLEIEIGEDYPIVFTNTGKVFIPPNLEDVYQDWYIEGELPTIKGRIHQFLRDELGEEISSPEDLQITRDPKEFKKMLEEDIENGRFKKLFLMEINGATIMEELGEEDECNELQIIDVK